MSQIALIRPTVDAVASVTQLGTLDLTKYTSAVLSTTGLAGAEEVAIFRMVGGAWVAYLDAAGTVQNFTLTKKFLQVPGGGIYGVTKTATVAAVGVYADPIRDARSNT